MKDSHIGQKSEVTFPCLTNQYFNVIDRKGHVAGRVTVSLTGTSRWPPVILSGWHCLEFMGTGLPPSRCAAPEVIRLTQSTDGSIQMLLLI